MPMDWERDRHFDDRYDDRFDRDSRGRHRREDRFARPDVREDAFHDEEEFLRGLEAAAGPSRYPRDRRDLDYGYPEGDPWDGDERQARAPVPHPDEMRLRRSGPGYRYSGQRYPGTPLYGQAGPVNRGDPGLRGYGFREAYRGDAPGLRRADHRGRGPKNYTRSDDRILEDVNDILSDDGHIDASDIEVEVRDGEVTLSGTVSSRFAKRHAEDLAERMSGVRNCQNNLRVVSGGPVTDVQPQD